jgi:dihydrofolate reductase
MRRLIMWTLVTLDGFFEGASPWDLEFHQEVWGEELEEISLEQLRSADALVFGRTTYEGMAAHWSAADGAIAELMNRLPKLVCSRTLQRADWRNSTLVRDAATEIPELKTRGDGNLFVFGSGKLSQTLLRQGLFDEYRIGLAPVRIGRGTPLFAEEAPEKLVLLEARALSTGCVFLRYRPAGSETPRAAA